MIEFEKVLKSFRKYGFGDIKSKEELLDIIFKNWSEVCGPNYSYSEI